MEMLQIVSLIFVGIYIVFKIIEKVREKKTTENTDKK